MTSANQPPGGEGRGRPPAFGVARPPQPLQSAWPVVQNPAALRPELAKQPAQPGAARPTSPPTTARASRNGQAGTPSPGQPAPPANPAAAKLPRPVVQPVSRRPDGQAGSGTAPAVNSPQKPAPSLPPPSVRTVPGAGTPYPPLQAPRPDGAVPVDPRPMAQRSPRAALQPEDMPMPPGPSRSKRVRNPIVIAGNALLTLVFLITVMGGITFVLGKQRFDLPGPLTEDKVVNVPRGGIRETAHLLMREGVIDQPNLFIAGALVLKAQNELKYGEYRFTRNASLRDVVDTIIEGKVVQHAFTIAEGLTSDQIVQRLIENETLTGNIRDIPREGTLLPETYRFTFGTTREQMIQRMRQSQQRALQEVWERRSSDLPIKTPEQLVTLASIIEKETGKADERTRVAAVFVNRLRQKMKLQSDPTIIYGLVGGKGSLGRPIQRNEIEQPTPYNTYVIDGLPPGPIANPGRASLEAAANPARTKELFFVADGTGGHVFADNYEAHQKNVARLRVIEQQAAQPRTSQPTTAPAFAPAQPATSTPRRAR